MTFKHCLILNTIQLYYQHQSEMNCIYIYYFIFFKFIDTQPMLIILFYLITIYTLITSGACKTNISSYGVPFSETFYLAFMVSMGYAFGDVRDSSQYVIGSVGSWGTLAYIVFYVITNMMFLNLLIAEYRYYFNLFSIYLG